MESHEVAGAFRSLVGDVSSRCKFSDVNARAIDIKVTSLCRELMQMPPDAMIPVMAGLEKSSFWGLLTRTGRTAFRGARAGGMGFRNSLQAANLGGRTAREARSLRGVSTSIGRLDDRMNSLRTDIRALEQSVEAGGGGAERLARMNRRMEGYQQQRRVLEGQQVQRQEALSRTQGQLDPFVREGDVALRGRTPPPAQTQTPPAQTQTPPAQTLPDQTTPAPMNQRWEDFQRSIRGRWDALTPEQQQMWRYAGIGAGGVGGGLLLGGMLRGGGGGNSPGAVYYG